MQRLESMVQSQPDFAARLATFEDDDEFREEGLFGIEQGDKAFALIEECLPTGSWRKFAKSRAATDATFVQDILQASSSSDPQSEIVGSTLCKPG